MKNEEYKIYIIGAGVSGLVAAKVLEDYGFCPIVVEVSDSVGGRVKTDIVENYQLDHGFQVLLTAYPTAKKYLDYESLELQEFLPGATIFKNGGQKTIGDPLRNMSLLFPTLFSGIGTFTDKLKILKLNALLKKTSLIEIFKKPEKTTLLYLQNFGFSEQMISQFFTPFFSGIFLEPDLKTSSRMFEFVYKMFGEGLATLPKRGIGAIPNQLKANLTKTNFKFNTEVCTVEEGKVVLKNGTVLESDFIIIATDPNTFISNLRNQDTPWKSCDTLYFETAIKTIQKPLIGLIADKEALINNIFYHSTLKTESTGNLELISATIVKEHNLDNEALISKVENDLKKYCGVSELKFLKHYSIPKALPDLTNIQYEILPSETMLTKGIYLAGDTQLNGSLNAAMLSGERAALGIIETFSKNTTSNNSGTK